MKDTQLAKGEIAQLLAGHKSASLHLRLQSIKKIEFNYLNVNAEVLQNLLDTLSGLRFECFVMSNCMFDIDCLMPFNALLQCVGIERLYFDNNRFNDIDILRYLQGVPNYLSHLSVIGNNIDDETALEICKLVNHRQIVSLDLSSNKLSSPTETVEKMFGVLEGSEIKRLALRHNHIGDDVQQIGFALQHYSVTLDYLDLSHNELGKQLGDVEVFLQTLLQGACVKVINLSFNSIFINYSLMPYTNPNQILAHIELNMPTLLGQSNLRHDLRAIKQRDTENYRLYGAYLRHRLNKLRFPLHEQLGNQVAANMTTLGPLRAAFLHGFNHYQLERKQLDPNLNGIEQNTIRRRDGKLGKLCKRFAKMVF